MKIALVHDYLTQRGGAERVFELLCRRFPEADVYTSVYDPEGTIDLQNRIVNTTGLQQIPGAARYFRLFAPLYFPAFRALDLMQYDLIISSSSSFAKAVRKRPGAQHICFCHNVTRFLWDTQTYLRGYREYQLLSPLIEPIFRRMRQVDREYAAEPDLYVANSSVVAERIRRVYRKPAIVINYPIDDSRFLYSADKADYYLVSSRLLSYKRIDIVVEAFNWLGWPLLITGSGPERDRLQEMALDNVQFLGHVDDAQRASLMAGAKAVIVAALEDYGLVPIESNFSGTPVVSFGEGGVLDTQVPGKTGVFFNRQTPDALQSALMQSSQIAWDAAAIRDHAMTRFTEAAFFHQIEPLVAKASGQLSQSLAQHYA
ncbi:MAG: glycosyltransferase [Cyanobacteria bacterium P01_A01_bin.123]